MRDPKKTIITLRTWVMRQVKRDDPVGDVARDVRDDAQLQGRKLTIAVIEERMRECGACENAHRALRQLALEWSRFERGIPTPQPRGKVFERYPPR